MSYIVLDKWNVYIEVIQSRLYYISSQRRPQATGLETPIFAFLGFGVGGGYYKVPVNLQRSLIMAQEQKSTRRKEQKAPQNTSCPRAARPNS